MKQVFIVGGGVSGIYALKWVLEECQGKAEVTLLEEKSDIGGHWRYTEDEYGGVSSRVRSVCSYWHWQSSDFAFPKKGDAEFPSHEEVVEYIKSYASNFKLWPSIKVNHRVTMTSRDAAGGWTLSVTPLKEGKQYTVHADYLILATGLFRIPHFPSNEAPYCHFKGDVIHSSTIKHAKRVVLFDGSEGPSLIGKSICVVGSGPEGTGITSELINTQDQLAESRLYLSMRHGSWMLDRCMGAFAPADWWPCRAVFWPGNHGTLLIGAIRLWFEGMFGPGGSGVTAWLPEAQFGRSMINFNHNVVSESLRYFIMAQRGIASIKGKEVQFFPSERTDAVKHTAEVDVLVLATGYKPILGVGDDMYHPEDCYQYMFPLHERDDIALVGSVRPIYGNKSFLAEMQARLVARVIAGKAMLPCKDTRRVGVRMERSMHALNFPTETSRPSVVHPIAYADGIASLIGVKPNLWKMYVGDRNMWWKMVATPVTAVHYNAQHPVAKKALEGWDFKKTTVTHWMYSTISFHHYLMYALIALIALYFSVCCVF